jgi:hypothetical protein
MFSLRYGLNSKILFKCLNELRLQRGKTHFQHVLEGTEESKIVRIASFQAIRDHVIMCHHASCYVSGRSPLEDNVNRIELARDRVE